MLQQRDWLQNVVDLDIYIPYMCDNVIKYQEVVKDMNDLSGFQLFSGFSKSTTCDEKLTSKSGNFDYIDWMSDIKEYIQ